VVLSEGVHKKKHIVAGDGGSLVDG
jgi:hypothetical protein